ncbi:hypothetical protein CHRYSEOSP005_07280 [Chryseobacterium sp. Alg-005]
MKNFLLLLGMTLFVLSCKKTETQDNTNVSDSATISDTITSVVPADTLSTVQDSTNRNNMNNTMNSNKADSLNR